jgi:hypothetical protein
VMTPWGRWRAVEEAPRDWIAFSSFVPGVLCNCRCLIFKICCFGPSCNFYLPPVLMNMPPGFLDPSFIKKKRRDHTLQCKPLSRMAGQRSTY